MKIRINENENKVKHQKKTVMKRNLKKQPPEVFCKKGVLKNFAKFTGKQLCQSLFFNKVAGLRHCCFPVNFAKFLVITFLQNISRRLLLNLQVLYLKLRGSKLVNIKPDFYSLS